MTQGEQPDYLGDDAIDAPLPAGTNMRIIWCRVCWAITGIITSSGLNGDPHAHELWHLQRGDI